MSQIAASPREKCTVLAVYQTASGAYDELPTTAGELRAHFAPLVRDLDRLGKAELKRRADTVRRLIHEQGITYNVYGDARGMERLWKIDPVPFVLAADEWSALEAALIQRATLINRILADSYGAQELIRSGWLPPALVFEQAWVARYLAYMLVEGQDITVRDDRVFLKALSGLETVDVILRRGYDDFCDPLELRNDSMLGVPGLLEALRAGNVAVANAPGSGLLQSPAFLSFLPGLCQHLLGEELRLPSVATWWCGQAGARQYVLEHLDQLFVKT